MGLENPKIVLCILYCLPCYLHEFTFLPTPKSLPLSASCWCLLLFSFCQLSLSLGYISLERHSSKEKETFFPLDHSLESQKASLGQAKARSFIWVSRFSGLGPSVCTSSAASPRPLAEGWLRSRAVGHEPAHHMGFLHHRLCQNASPCQRPCYVILLCGFRIFLEFVQIFFFFFGHDCWPGSLRS